VTTDTTTSDIPRHPLYLNECDLILPFIPSMTPPANHSPSACPFLSLLPDPLNSFRHTRTISLLRVRSQTTSDTSTPLTSTSAPSGGSTLPRKCCHDESSELDSRSTVSMGPKVCVEDHHLHLLPILRHPLQSQHLNEHDLISPLIPPMPPPPPNHPPPTLPNPPLPSQPKSRRTSPSSS